MRGHTCTHTRVHGHTHTTPLHNHPLYLQSHDNLHLNILPASTVGFLCPTCLCSFAGGSSPVPSGLIKNVFSAFPSFLKHCQVFIVWESFPLAEKHPVIFLLKIPYSDLSLSMSANVLFNLVTGKCFKTLFNLFGL